MARRTRSLSELPGHLRVPILRRKDTERTKERLAAGIAGMEELKSLRQQQQQLVGATVAKAEDRRQERRHGDVGQTNHSSRLSWSTFCGYSMDSILEEGDGPANSYPREDIGKDDRYHCDINNNRDNKNGSDNESTRSQIPLDESTRRSPDPETKPCDPNQVYSCQSPIRQSLENESRIANQNKTDGNNELDSNPLRRPNGNDSFSQKHSPTYVGQDKVSPNPVAPYRRCSLSDWHCHPVVSASASPRQRSMSVDMGHNDMGSRYPSRYSPPSNIANGHKFSSLTAIDVNTCDVDNAYSNANVTTLHITDRERLCQSTSQLNNVGHQRSVSTTSLKRRGSLTWDNLLESIGIQNSTSLTSLDKIDSSKVGAKEDTEDADAFDSNSIKSDEKYKILMNRKKGRSMSFTCGNYSTPLMNPLSHYKDRGCQQSATDGRVGTKGSKQSSETNSHPSKAIHPILRRASIQCEAVLTHCNRVVNPIQDVDVNSFKNPGPLHAVMLQYQGYKSPQMKPGSIKNISNTSNPRAQASPVQDVSNKCLHSKMNSPSPKVKQCVLQSSNGSSDLSSSPLRTSERELIPKPNPSMKQDLTPDNITQESTNTVSTPNSESEKTPQLTGHCDRVDTGMDIDTSPDIFTDKEQNKHESVEFSSVPVIPVPNEDSENKLFEITYREERCTESPPITPPQQSFPLQKQKHVSSLRQSPSDMNSSDSHPKLLNDIPTVVEPESSCLINREKGQYCETVTIPQQRQVSNHHEQCVTTGHRNKMVSDNISNTNENHCCNNDTKVTVNSDFKRKETKGKDDDESKFGKENVKVSESQSVESSQVILASKCQPNKRTCSRLDGKTNTVNNRCNVLPYSNSNLSSSSLRPQAQLYEFDKIDDRYERRNKRSSIFSDVSLISNSSSKTPSSAASIFSDVSMVSDEGYSTCESLSHENKSIFSTRLHSVSEQTSLSFSNSSPFEKESEICKNQTNTIDAVLRHCSKNNNAKQSGNENDQRNEIQNFHYKKEISLESSAPVVFQTPAQNQRRNLQHTMRRKVFKQTTV